MVSVSEAGVVSILGTGTAEITVRLGYTTNYYTAYDKVISINVAQKEPEIIEKTTPKVELLPTVAERIYNPAVVLADSDLTGGSVVGTGNAALKGTWSWKVPGTIPVVGNTGYMAVFTPEDTTNYNPVEVMVAVPVNKAEAAPNMPEPARTAEKTCKKVSDVLLPAGWEWAAEDKNLELKSEQVIVATAIYNGTDKGNYKKESIEIAVTRAAGEEEIHVHTGGTAACTKKAVCTSCNQEYGSVDSGRHGETEIRNRKEATCKEQGYTGDTYCKACNVVIAAGAAVSKNKEHIWDAGKITKTPTTAEKGVKTYTCTVCSGTKTEEIPVLEVSDNKENTEGTDQPDTSEDKGTIEGTDQPDTSEDKETVEGTDQPDTSEDKENTEVTDQPDTSVDKENTGGTDQPDTSDDKENVEGTNQPGISDKTETSENNGKPNSSNNNKPEISGESEKTDTQNNGKKPEIPGKTEVQNNANSTKDPYIPGKTETNVLSGTTVKEKINETLKVPAKNTILVEKKSQAQYRIHIADAQNGTVEYVKPLNKKDKKLLIPETVTVDGITYKVTSIAKNAFSKSKITEVIIGANVKTIGAKAFYKCKKLKKITIHSTSLTKKTIGKNAFKGVSSKTVVEAPKGKLKTYRKILKARGASAKAKFICR